jgi:uncharacterized protein YidB (DUF937 family)
MSFLDQIGSLFKGEGENGSTNIITALIEEQGGLGNLIETFKSAGLGDTITSWLGSGENLPIDVEQIRNALGDTTLSNLAEKFGLDTETMGTQLSEVLPNAIDKLSPEGLNLDNLLEQGLSFLKGKLQG